MRLSGHRSIVSRSSGSRARGRRRGSKTCRTVLLVALLLVSLTLTAGMLSGCGLETEEANAALKQANAHQQEAEAHLAALSQFPSEWEAIFNVPAVGPDQINQARQVLQAREQDLEALEQALKDWGRDLNEISNLNVEQKIKEYVDLKMNAVKCWSEYTIANLRPLLKAYEGMVELIAYGRPQSEIDAAAVEIAELTRQSQEKLAECKSADKQAGDFYKENKLGQ